MLQVCREKKYKIMKLAHNIKVSVFEYKENDLDRTENCLKKLFPFDIENYLKKKIAVGFNDKEIQTYEVKIEKTSLVNKFLEHFFNKLNDEQKELLLRQKRMDENLHFFIRLDKEKLFL